MPTTTAIRTTCEQQALPTIENDTCPQRSLYVTGTITPSRQGNRLGNISTAHTQEPFSGLGGTDQKTNFIPCFLVLQPSLCFHCHGFTAGTATDALMKGNMLTRAAIRTTCEQQALPTIENDTCPQRSLYVTGTITPSRQGNRLGYISTAHTQEPFSGLGGTDQKSMFIPSFLVLQPSLCFHCHGFTAGTATDALMKGNVLTRAAIRTTCEQQALPTIENDTCPQRSLYVTGTITPSRQGNRLGYISTARTQEPFSGLGGTNQKTMLIPSFLVLQLSQCFHFHGFTAGTATNALKKGNMPTRTAIRTTCEQQA
ncbi:hypothetical protein MRX96_003047 [Rhipicephalus microplus]